MLLLRARTKPKMGLSKLRMALKDKESNVLQPFYEQIITSHSPESRKILDSILNTLSVYIFSRSEVKVRLVFILP